MSDILVVDNSTNSTRVYTNSSKVARYCHVDRWYKVYLNSTNSTMIYARLLQEVSSSFKSQSDPKLIQPIQPVFALPPLRWPYSIILTESTIYLNSTNSTMICARLLVRMLSSLQFYSDMKLIQPIQPGFHYPSKIAEQCHINQRLMFRTLFN